jgi:CRP-like cAMP-binding protein
MPKVTPVTVGRDKARELSRAAERPRLMSADTQHAAALLSRSTLFGALSRAEIERLAASPRVRVKKGEELFAAGAPANAVYLILSGEVSLEIADADGRSISVSTARAGDVMGELAVLDGKPRSVAARASADAVLLSLSAPAFLTLVRAHPDFAMAIIRDLAAKVRRTNGQVSGLTFQTLKARIALFLIDLADSQGAEKPVLKITQNEIAGRLGASREKVNGHLQAMKDVGAISLARGRITVDDLETLKEMSGADD